MEQIWQDCKSYFHPLDELCSGEQGDTPLSLSPANELENSLRREEGDSTFSLTIQYVASVPCQLKVHTWKDNMADEISVESLTKRIRGEWNVQHILDYMILSAVKQYTIIPSVLLIWIFRAFSIQRLCDLSHMTMWYGSCRRIRSVVSPKLAKTKGVYACILK